MDIDEVIKNRVSIRTYKTDFISIETVLKIIDTAKMAPSWANKQCWKFLIVDSHVERKIIGKTSGQANIAKACEDAPYIIVLCANPKDSGVKNGMEYYMFDSGLVMENLLLAASSEGLATCTVSWFDEKAIKGLLNIPENFRVIAFTPLGYCDENVNIRSRKKLDEIVFYNTWGKNIKSEE
jgi:nitroreductase